MLDFDRLLIPQNADDTTTLLYDILSKCDLSLVITDNEGDMITAMRVLTTMIKNVIHTCCSVEDIHICCIEHVVNLGTKDFLQLVHTKIKNRDLLCAIISSVKHRGMYEQTQLSFGLSNQIPPLNVETSLDVEMRWCPT